MLRGSGPALIAAALATSLTAAQGGDLAQDAIRSALLQWTADFNARKSGQICDLFASDLRYDSRGQPERGYRDICDLLQRSLRDPTRHYSYSPEIKEIIVSSDMAVVRLIWILTVISEGRTDAMISKEPGLDVFRRQPDGHWKIIRYMAYEDAS
jgi:ketosteroid isomerase-like protein